MIRHMKGAFTATVLGTSVLGATLFTAPAIAADDCMQPREAVADEVRYVQTHLNVAALMCRGPRYQQFPALYNRFIRKNRHHLINGREAMISLVARLDVSLDTYLTRSFNRVSFESTRTDGFCDRALAALRQSVGSPDPLDMLPLLPVAYQPPANRCGYAGQAVTADARPNR
ncbi:hypothetical protein [Kordiimonas marina]|uniref:hypothetical protein n=1 Tax=Kordiimonas marina TaxID=2872312 RepID=UPI001FF4C9B5|nr:hypothetical protein [Kordiimonas marina]MCJ9430232.1 hypothetical protein [Kordiimonas marina]